MNPLYKQMKTSVFERMSLLATQHGAVNLGQGFPDFGWPEQILEAAARALKEGSNQYAPSRGLPALPRELHGTSAFLRDRHRVFHTYSTYARGTEQVGGTHYYLDMTALGRQEEWEEPRERC